jgi:hypothetical protein
MSFSVSLADEVARRLAAWNLKKQAMRAILDGFDRLGQNPSLLRRATSGDNPAMEFDLIVPDEDDPYQDAYYVFGIKYATDEETLMVVGCQRLRGNTIE